ncbi:uncharacterized protein LOC144903114 [Branchiostoma floridae x Branchiostoma belcheri]
MKLLLVAVILSFAAYAASQTTITCFQCSAGLFDSITSTISGSNACLEKANDPNTTVPTVTGCPVTSKCFTKLKTILGYAHGVERDCWDDDDDTCDSEVSSACANAVGTGTCIKCCNTDRCNSGFAQRTGVLNGATGVHGFSVLALLPVAVAMFY